MLVGFMGAGKSTVGRALAAQLGWGFEDLDQRIERRENSTVAEIFRNSGEAEFRRCEHAALKEMLGELDTGSGKIIALGGGAFVHEPNALLIETLKIPTVFLDAAVDELWRRCMRQAAASGMERPLLEESEGFRELYKKRRSYYLKASFIHDTGGKMVEQIATELIQVLGLAHRDGN